MRILLTGHEGYIGAVLGPMLLARGHEVVGLDAAYYAESHDRAADVRDVEALEGFDAVAHLAALSNDPVGNLDARLTDDINFRSSVRLACLAKRAGVRRFVFSSSCSNYGAAGGNVMTEESALHPVTPYGESKVKTEEALRAMASDGFSPVFLRNATAYGVSPRFRSDLVVNNMVAWAHATGRIRILSDGTPWRPLVHVEDIAQAFVAALEAPRDAVHAEVFNIGRNEENHQVRDVAAIIADAMPHVSIEYAPGGGPDRRDYRVSFDKAARRLPGFAARHTVRGSVEALAAFCAGARLTVEDIDGPRFARIARIRQLLGAGALDSELRWKEPPR